MATTTATNSSQASPSPFPASLLAGFPPRNFQINNTSASPSSTPISSTSTTSSTVNGSGVFPNGTPNQQQMGANLFNPNYYAALMQSQVMQQFMKQYMLAGTDANGHGNDSRSPSTTTASPSLGQPQQQKKLFLDPDGNILCPICDQKIGPDLWAEHLKFERANLSKSIESLKENKRPNTLFNNVLDGPQPVPETRRKREFELTRIRTNQQKRLSMKGTLMSSSALRDTSLLLPQNAAARMPQNGKFLIGSLCETPPPRSASGMSGRNGNVDGVDRDFCKSCKRIQEFLIIANGLEEPRCMDCYRKYRRQVGALPLTITESPTDESIQTNGHRHGSHTTSSASPVQRDASGSTSGTPNDEDDMFGHQEELDEKTPMKRPKLESISE